MYLKKLFKFDWISCVLFGNPTRGGVQSWVSLRTMWAWDSPGVGT